MRFTVFTPTYNRAYRIEALYESLKNQTFKDFEWLIVDDGSSDDTRELITKWLYESSLCIRYFYKENGGKCRAMNVGIDEAKGDLFFVVDSDDVLPANALERINYYYEQVKNDDTFGGVCGLKCYADGQPTDGHLPEKIVDWLYVNRNYKGDTAVVFKTKVVQQYKFPDYKGEKYCAPGFVYNKIGSKYKLRFFDENVYECEYLPDGLSAASVRLRYKSPTYATHLYLDMIKMPISIKRKVKSGINFWRFFFLMKSHKAEFASILPIGFYTLLPIGVIMHMRDRLLFNKDMRPQHK